MKNLTFLILLIFTTSCLIGSGQNSQINFSKNNYFPQLSGIDLTGKERILPAAFNNDFNLVVVAFRREQQSSVDKWIKAVKPILKNNNNLSFFEIPLIYELSGFKRMWINNGMRLGIPNLEARKRTITVYTNRDKFFEITNMQEAKIYALLLNNKGKILWQSEGVPSDNTIKKLKSLIKTN